MKLAPNPDSAAALAGLLGWFDTIRGPDGYGGPAIATRAQCLAWCGPAADWRLEGIFDARARLLSTDPEMQEKLLADLAALGRAQLGDGSFRNSYFEWNPFEGGMPHEPALLASALRARRTLADAGTDVPGLATTVERALLGRHLRLLWNKSLRTARDWEITDFEFGQAVTAAAVLDLLLEWTDWQGGLDELAPYAEGLLAWLIRLQKSSGALAGGILASNRRGSGISPFHTARCLGPLRALARRMNHNEAARAADQAATFLAAQALPGGGFKRLLWSWRPESLRPLFTGAVAAILTALHDDGALDEGTRARQESWLLGAVTPTGAFRNAFGFGSVVGNAGRDDWRDWIPCAGWQDKILAYLSRRVAPGALPPARVADFETNVLVDGKPGLVRETSAKLEIDRAGSTAFRWHKNSSWPEICTLS